MINHYENIDTRKIDASIEMLELYITDFDIEDIIAQLKLFKKDKDNDAIMIELRKKLSALGPEQGAILTYAPYVALLMSDDPFENGV